jgi:hypothetical protein
MVVLERREWTLDAQGLRIDLKHANPPDIDLSMVGIRCARSDPSSTVPF